MWFSMMYQIIVFGGRGASIISTCIFEQISYVNHEQKPGLGFRNPEASVFDFVYDCVKIHYHHHHLRTKKESFAIPEFHVSRRIPDYTLTDVGHHLPLALARVKQE